MTSMQILISFPVWVRVLSQLAPRRGSLGMRLHAQPWSVLYFWQADVLQLVGGGARESANSELSAHVLVGVVA